MMTEVRFNHAVEVYRQGPRETESLEAFVGRILDTQPDQSTHVAELEAKLEEAQAGLKEQAERNDRLGQDNVRLSHRVIIARMVVDQARRHVQSLLKLFTLRGDGDPFYVAAAKDWLAQSRTGETP